MQAKEQNISPIKQRILHFFDTLDISKRDFYAKMGVSRGTLEAKNGITEDVMAKFIATFPEVSIEWLINGSGSMLGEDLKSKNIEIVATKSNIGIPLLPVSAMAGIFNGDLSVLEYECERYVVPIFKDADFLISVKGSSMSPKYSSGDIVACKKLPIDTFFQWNKVYVLDTDQGPLIKRIDQGSTDDTLLIVSENTKYRPFELPRKHIYNIALVLGVIRLE